MSDFFAPRRALAELLQGISTFPYPASLEISNLCLDSRKIKHGDCFFAYPGNAVDGRDFIPQALEAGAAVVLYEPHPGIQPSERCIPILNLQQHIGTIASRFWQLPQDEIIFIGITGTNGKSTCTYWLAHGLEQAGIPSAVIGTIGLGPVHKMQAATLTTPDPVSLHEQFAKFYHQGIRAIVMEVSSHSLVQHRVVGVPFRFVGFTNLSHEHLDYHGTMREYANAKAKLFDFDTIEAAVINADDDIGRQWLSDWSKPYELIATSIREPAPKLPVHVKLCRAHDVQVAPQGCMTFTLDAEFAKAQWSAPVMGAFNVENTLLCAAILHCCGVDATTVQTIIKTLPAVPGRLQIIRHDKKASCVVDYAHTPQALEKSLQSLRQHCQGKLWCVFGCGGDRDQAKRPEMGMMAMMNADQCVLTDDNPRSEAPEKIIEDIRVGLSAKVRSSVPYIAEREAAIQYALKHADPKDMILVAGKGHETVQIRGQEKIPCNDVEIVRRLMESE